MSQPVLDRPTLDPQAARQRMVDAQIRPAQINDPRIVAILRQLPREDCVPASLRDFAYADRSLPLGGGRVLTEPRVVARLLQVARPQAGEKVLVVGASTGYACAVLARLGLTVVALEERADLTAIGRRFCAEHGASVTWHEGPLSVGVPQAALFDLIVIDGTVTAIPDAYGAQLSPQGRVAGVLTRDEKVACAFVASSSAAGWEITPQFDAALPLLPELAPLPEFAL